MEMIPPDWKNGALNTMVHHEKEIERNQFMIRELWGHL